MADRKPTSRNYKPAAKPAFSLGRLVVGLVKWCATLVVWGIIAGILVAGWFYADLPDIDDALEATRRPTVTLVSADGQVLAAKGDLYGVPVQLGDLPAALPNAVLATEDRRFYNHYGIDFIGLGRATWANIQARRIVQGGSTLTQQVAKNLFLTPERSIKRKVQELMLAFWLEYKFSKEQILTIYLNRVYLGAGTYGVDAAARKYFGRPASKVSTYEAALLAGLLKAPSRYNPLSSKKRAHGRTVQVLRNLVAAGYLTAAQAKAAEKGKRRALVTRTQRVGRHFADWVLEQVSSYVSDGDRDLSVITTLDARLQAKAEKYLEQALAGEGKKRGARNGAIVILGKNGAVRAMVGGRNYSGSQFNRVTQAKRQPGSAFKPLVYLAGLEAGLKPSSVMVDAPVKIDGWAPKNFKGQFEGEMTIADALARSVNTIAVKVAQKAGPRRIVKTARRLGISAAMTPDLSLALGTAEMTLLELTAAYGPLANGGFGMWPFGIQEIRDGDGASLYRRQGAGPGRVVLPHLVGAMNQMMSGVITVGTGKNAAIDRPAAGKTGTSQNYRDAWFVGYSADFVGGVWIGNDNADPMKRLTGGGLPARLWARVMKAAHGKTTISALPAGQVSPGHMDSRINPALDAEPEVEEKDGFLKRILNAISEELN
jgi:penicillin-binding protein 1A